MKNIRTQAYCKVGDHMPEHVVVFFDDDESGVLVRGADGVATNRFDDGVAGVPDDMRAAAEESDVAYCMEHHCDIEWIAPSAGANAAWSKRQVAIHVARSLATRFQPTRIHQSGWRKRGVSYRVPGYRVSALKNSKAVTVSHCHALLIPLRMTFGGVTPGCAKEKSRISKHNHEMVTAYAEHLRPTFTTQVVADDLGLEYLVVTKARFGGRVMECDEV